ncbi:hypothetical protein H1O16_gp184 [Burkholderia phage BcepSaruman]|uniref:Uncharacterized protein n=1 Tax=Burkholderia phage BcepSaruman TaxID=2530032 RepID=A0A4D5ZEA7_9CAUD|nr:hypothetical protein H1O16_gp184 [Burkholderia phage BcepSaruman]QBX06597.1 hypothetical protein BcepSaruman_184 [Burkholderia phage BcepSaruman]
MTEMQILVMLLGLLSISGVFAYTESEVWPWYTPYAWAALVLLAFALPWFRKTDEVEEVEDAEFEG